MKDSFSFSPNSLTASASGKRMPNPYFTLYRLFPWMNSVISGVHVNTWGPFVMDCSRSACVQYGPMCTGMASSTYFYSKGYVGCWTASGGAPRVPPFLELMKAIREGDCVVASKFSRAMYHRW